MEFSVESLLKSGFTKRELRYIYNNIYSFGGTLEEIVRDLAKRFKVFIYIFIFTVISCSLVIYFKWSDPWYVFSCVITLLVFDLIMLFIQPPVISFKCWRFCRVSKA
ncbi:MAG: Uncharacterized protein H6R25_3906 [Proteobacteria bacterium]|nr:Uncharacterized protein [Pseudomonadota bacterium]